MAACVALLGCLCLVLSVHLCSADFNNQDEQPQLPNGDLVFEDAPIPHKWRTVGSKQLVKTNSLDSKLLKNHRLSDSETGLWKGTLRTLQRLKRSLWGWGDSEEETTVESTSIPWLKSNEKTPSTQQSTVEPETSNTISRETRSTDDVDDFINSRTRENLESLRVDNDDDEEFNRGTSGDHASGDDDIGNDNDVDLLPGPSTQDPYSQPDPNLKVYNRFTLMVHEPYKDEYGNRESEAFKELSSNISKAVDNLYEDLPGTHKSLVVNIEPREDDNFYSIITMDLESMGYTDPHELRRVMEDQIVNFNKLGQYSVTHEGFTVREFGARTEPTVPDYSLPYSPRREEEPALTNSYPGVLCALDEIQCDLPSGAICLAGDARCNGTRECLDGRDEDGCPAPPPPESTTTTTTTTSTTTTTTTTTPLPTTTTKEDPYNSPQRTASPSSVPEQRCRADDIVRCADGSRFICSDEKCDGKPDCPGGDDESDCPLTDDCPAGEFMCDVTRCIPEHQVCDGQFQCSDQTDEQNCPTRSACMPDQFQCTDESGCVDRQHYCDGRPDCADASDEAYCLEVTDVHVCPLGQFRCAVASLCIPLTKRCDGRIDCVTENSDEMGCPCREDQFKCTEDETCIDKTLQCNGEVDCPVGGSDEKDCNTTSPLRECKISDFKCRSGMCIDMSRKCNAYSDCPDNSDEQNCPYPVLCAADQFRCRTGHCVPSNARCDRNYDCPDGSDEENCDICLREQFRCNDGHCLSLSAVCNGLPECREGEDERNCPYSCQPYEFQCRDSRKCIYLSKKCDSFPDCNDASDEEDCEDDLAPCPSTDFTCKDGSCVPKRKRCDGRQDCPDGLDEVGCSDGNPVHCMANEFRCTDGVCIQAKYRCDNVTDCSDRSDEQNCRQQPCREDEITCGDGSCRRGDLRCDGTNDCPDGADERDCRCRNDEFRCRDGSCVSYLSRCDRRNDCRDGSDEENCAESGPCHISLFRCRSGQCIPQHQMCDNRTNCYDGSDEQGCRDYFIVKEHKAPPVTQAPVTCAYGQFACHSGTQCVPQSAHCDNKHDCNDYSDEINCAANPSEGLNLKTYPTDQIIKESREVVFQCRDESPIRAMVNWVRADGLPLPPGSRNTRGRLEMPNIQLEHTGTYICEAGGFNPSIPGSRVNVYLKVEPFEHPTVPPRKVCGFTEATCSNGECINKAQVCDGRYDCTDGSDELRCNPHGCEPNEFRCDNKKCVQKTWRCDSDDDCGDGSDEKNCAPSPPGSMCRYDEFKCSKVDQCIPKAFHCDIEIDCQDGSDEIGCSKAEIQQGPPFMVKKLVGESMTITCTVVGVPTPEVVWRLNWGHIPSKCTSTSVNGHGTLTCPNLQVSDQGAYSCEALNNRGSTFAVPDTILMVQSNGSLCPPGSFNALATRPDECIQCFCFGVSTTCQSADFFIYQLPPPLQILRAVGVYLPPGGKMDVRRGDSQFYNAVQQVGQAGFQISVGSNDISSSYYNPVYPYFALPEHYHNNQLKSYGGYLKYTVRTDGTGSPLSIPDVILSGNGYTLVYRVPQISPNTENNIAVRFFSPGDWFHVGPDNGREYPASRQELMMALENVDQILIRAKYFADGLETTISDINMDSAGSRDLGQGQAAYVEQCQCPAGYTGNSCEMCEATHRHQAKGPWLGICEPPVQCPPKYYKDPRDDRCYPCPCPHTDSYQFGVSCELGPDNNVTCSCPPGYQGRRCEMCAEPLYVGNPLQGRPCVKRPDEPECDAAGSKATYRNPSTGRCDCKELVTGPTCNQCKPNTFHLASDNVLGCISCFCMGINATCTSSDLYRDQITSAFTRDNQDFKLTEANQLSNPISDIQVNPSAREIYFQQFNPGTVYYWMLPSKFLYNKVTSYGGFLRYTLRYVPSDGGRSSPNSAPDVEIVSDNGVQLVHFTRLPVPTSNTPVAVSIPLREQYWSRVDGSPTTREHLLMALAELTHILIKATYTTNAQESALLSVSLDIGTDERNTGQNRALEVERCYCPVGYRGTSCEECQAGYTRVDVDSLYLGTCEPCECHGHSNECDPDTGHCMNCQGNTEGANCERCVRGYSGNPEAGEHCRPSGPGCTCDPRGTTHQGCDSAGNCVCKTNVVGQSCSECRRGTFNLAEANTEGCIECYCSGVPTVGDCHSSNLYREAIPMQIIDRNHQFTLVDISRRKVIRDNFNLNPAMNEIGYDLSNNPERLFWSLPPSFTGNKILSYGGNLNYTQRYTALPNYPPSLDTDVIIEGPTMSIYWTDDGYIQPNIRKSTFIPLREQHWRRLDQTVGQRQASRAELLKVLSNVQAIMIRANPSTHTQESFLSDVSLDTAVSQRTASGVAVEVEVCQCPDGYRGTSCESCSPGFYQDFDGTCKKCPCNNNEEHCALGPQQQVICTCRSPYGGTYCDRTVDLMLRMHPDQVTAPVGTVVRFTCSYHSSERLRVEFDETYYPVLPRSLIKPLQLVSEVSNAWGTNHYLDAKIKPELKMVSCKVRNSGGELLGTLSSMIHPEASGTHRPPDQPTISISIMEPTVIVIEAGRDYTFRCTGRSLVSFRPIELRWSKENGELPSGRTYDDRSGLLIIRDVQLTDAGYYICTASDGQAFVTERALLNVGGYRDTRPVITVTPRSLDVREGEPVEFRCEATGVPTPTLRWVGDRSSRLPPQSSFASGVFRIPYASLQDEGTYTCTATNSAGEDSETVSLYVQSAPATPPPPPDVQLTIQPQDYRGVAGETVKVECVVSSPRSANIRLQWARQDGELSSNARDSNGLFTIYNSEPTDSGIYSCTAIERTTGAVAKQVQVRIFVSPHQRPVEISIEPPRQTAPQGTTAVLRCITSDGPVHWSKAGGNMPPHARVEGDTLRIERIQISDRGVYMCQVDGPTGPTSVTSILEVERREAPEIELYPRASQTVVEGGSVLYQCRLTKGIPSPTVTWSRVDGTPMSHQVEQLPYGVLRFTSVTRADEGQYLCTADNVEGSASTVAVLEVHSPPLITITPPGQTIQVSPGQMVRLDCRAYGHPKPEVWWTKDSRSYDRSYTEPRSVTSKSVEAAVYEIKGVRTEDTGSYTCLASSDAGTREQRIQLIINEEASSSGQNRGDIPSSSATIYPNDYYTVPLGGHVTFRCIAQGPQPIYLEWVRRNGQPLGPHARQLNGELYISQVQYADGGEYSCRGLSPSREELFTAVATLKVTATGPMAIKLEPERQVVRPGDNAMITCTATGEEPINMSWESDTGRPLPPNILARGGIIQFNGIKESDAGRYVCKAQNRVGTLSATADVIVNDQQTSSTFVRAADRHPVAIEGTTVALRCDTPNYQQITWTRDYGVLPVDRVSIDGPVLRINNLQLEDAGRYTCHTTERGISAQDYIDLRIERNPCASDEFLCKEEWRCIPLLFVCDNKSHCADGSDESTCQIRPGRAAGEVELQIEPNTRDVHYGEPVELRCQATGPHVKLHWTRVDGPLPPSIRTYGNTLRINSATSEHNGVYRCTAILNNNRYDKEYSLTILDDRPTHDAASAETVTAEYGQTVRLDCAIDLEGSVTHQWSKHGGTIPPNAPVSGPHLTIPSVTHKDAGLYICTASNGNITADIPKIILVRGAVPFFTQAPRSYLALPTLSNGYLNFTIDISFKPEQNHGLILYNGQQDGGSGDFISFGLRDGIPEFRFDVGSGVGLMSGQRPLALGTWHTVQLNRNRKDGSMFVDGEDYYSNSSQGRMQGLDLAQPLYLGGVPDFRAIHKNNGFDRGFVGCISRLVIGSAEEIDIMKEQKELEGVTSCETCAVNPCTNQGVCQEAPTRAGYTCLCPRGFSGLNCSHQGEPCYPGVCGSGRCLDTDNGLQCYCGLGKAGERCDRDITVTEPSLSKNSYLAYPTPKMTSKLKVALKFNPSDNSNGLLLYCAENNDGTGDFISMSIKDNYLEFKFDTGAGLTVVRSENPVKPGQWQSASATILGREASLSVTGDDAPVTHPIRTEVLKLTTPLYVGGYDQQRVRLANAVGVKHGFHGCINEVQVAGLNLDLMLSVVDSANIGQCQMGAGDQCLLRPCRNGGVCSPSDDRSGYRCECPDSFTGDNCEFEQDMCVVLQDPCLNGGTCVGSASSYTCHCPMGFAGPTCLDRVEFRTEVQFNGDGYVELSRELMPHSDPDASELVLVEFTTAQPNGLLLWHGQTPDVSGVGQDYLALYVDNGYLTLSYELGSKPAKIRSEQQVNDGQRHRVEIKRKGVDGTLIVDGRLAWAASEGLLTQLNTKGNIYIGGLPNIEHMTGSQIGSITNFVGCINSLSIQNSGEINFAEIALNSVNVRPCSSSNGIEDDDYGPSRGDQGR